MCIFSSRLRTKRHASVRLFRGETATTCSSLLYINCGVSQMMPTPTERRSPLVTQNQYRRNCCRFFEVSFSYVRLDGEAEKTSRWLQDGRDFASSATCALASLSRTSGLASRLQDTTAVLTHPTSLPGRKLFGANCCGDNKGRRSRPVLPKAHTTTLHIYLCILQHAKDDLLRPYSAQKRPPDSLLHSPRWIVYHPPPHTPFAEAVCAEDGGGENFPHFFSAYKSAQP